MKKIILLLLVAVMVIAGVAYAAEPAIIPRNDGAVAQMKNTAPRLSSEKGAPPLLTKKVMTAFEPALLSIKDELVEEPVVEQFYHNDDIPLAYEEQEWLQTACKEFDVPYALALGLIEKETTFRNLVGDDGTSTGYMQIQKKWHWDRMERLGVTDLMEPSGNFRVGCDFLSELYGKYNDWNVALTVYNMGHDPGFVTDYAKEVMRNYARWQEIIDNHN